MSSPAPHRFEQVFANTPLCCPVCRHTLWVARPLPALARVHCQGCGHLSALVNHDRGPHLFSVHEYAKIIRPQLADCLRARSIEAAMITILTLPCLGLLACTAIRVPGMGHPLAWTFAGTFLTFVAATLMLGGFRYLDRLAAAHAAANRRLRALQSCFEIPVSPVPAWVAKS